MMRKYKTIDAYIKSFPSGVRGSLRILRAAIKKVAPKAEEGISYGMPVFRLKGFLVYFAAYKTHIGFYPGSGAIVVFKKELSKYDTSKGTIRFPLNKKLPLPLIRKIVAYRVKQNHP